MEEETLLAFVTDKAQSWIKGNYDAATREEVQQMLDSEDKTKDSSMHFTKIWNLAPAVCGVSWVPAVIA